MRFFTLRPNPTKTKLSKHSSAPLRTSSQIKCESRISVSNRHSKTRESPPLKYCLTCKDKSGTISLLIIVLSDSASPMYLLFRPLSGWSTTMKVKELHRFERCRQLIISDQVNWFQIRQWSATLASAQDRSCSQAGRPLSELKIQTMLLPCAVKAEEFHPDVCQLNQSCVVVRLRP